MNEAEPVDPGSVRAVARAVNVLRQFDSVDRRLTLGELAVAANLAKSTLTRLVTTLEGEGLLSRDVDGGYRPGIELMRWAGLAGDVPAVPAAVLEGMSEVAHDLGESISLHIRRGDARMALACVESSRTLRHIVPLHQALPLYRGAVSWVLLGDTDGGTLQRVQRQADDALVDVDVQAEVRAARANGYSRSDGGYEPGVTGLAVPVSHPDGGPAFAALAVGGPTSRLTGSNVEAHALEALQSVVATCAPRLSALAQPRTNTQERGGP